jgi:hypothetical protein
MRLPPEDFRTARLRLRKPNPDDAEAVFDRRVSDPADGVEILATPKKGLRSPQPPG